MEIKELKASELRIGNYYNHNEEIRQVTPNTILEVWESEREWCKPIPLTEDVLLKFGFELYDYEPNSNIINNDDFIYLSYKNKLEGKGYYYTITNTHYGSWQFCVKVEWAEELLIAELKTVHQLQNIYFALTNEELTWK
jgi:hypothetical protein